MHALKGFSATNIIFILSLLCSESLRALELSVEAYSELEYSNNLNLRSTHGIDEFIHVLGSDITVTQRERSYLVNLNISAENEYYLNETYTDEVSFSTGIGILNFGEENAPLRWNSSFNRSEIIRDDSDRDTPDGNSYRNVTRTGPIFTYSLSPSSRANLSANYILVENSDEVLSDTERYDATLRFSQAYNEITDWYLSSRYEEILEGDGSEEYERASYTVGFERQFSGGDIDASMGITELYPENSDSSRDTFFNLRITKRQVLWHDLTLAFNQDISDTSIGFDEVVVQSQVDSSGDIASEVLVRGISINDVIERRQTSLSFRRDLVGFGYSWDISYSKESYLNSGFSETEKGIGLLVQQRAIQGLSILYGVDFELQESEGILDSGEDKTLEYSVAVEYAFTADTAFSLQAEQVKRTNKTDASREYDGLSIGIGIVWTLL